MRKYKHVIWDWNGTLLDDAGIVVDSMNTLLSKRGLPGINMEKYRDIFTFPVRDYYLLLGFDFALEPFEILAGEYMEEFNSDKYTFRLFDHVYEVLGGIQSAGLSQSILSACREEELLSLVERFGIKKYFSGVAGLNDHYAAGKLDRGKKWLEGAGIDPGEAILVGDTVHDYEVSRELGCDCLLVPNGHQSHERLTRLETNIVDSLPGVLNFISMLNR